MKVLWLCQMPYEIFHTLHECLIMATQELGAFYKKQTTQVGTDELIPYLLLVVTKAFSLQYRADDFDKRLDGFKVRLLLCEHFSSVQIGMS